jgi:hypothetical protein
MRAVATGYITVIIVSCTPRPSATNPEPSLEGASSSAATRAGVDPSVKSVDDAAPSASSPAREGEVCATYSTQQPDPTFQRPCAPGLVCCVPPHGAVMPTETARCRVPCKPTPPSDKPQIAGCSGNGCPFALVP